MAAWRSPEHDDGAPSAKTVGTLGLTRRKACHAVLGAAVAACTAPPILDAYRPETILPFDADAAGRLIVTLDVFPYGRHRFLIDTGAGVSAIYEEGTLSEAAEPSGAMRRIWGLGGAANVPAASIPSQQAGGLILPRRAGILLPPSRAVPGVAGIIGMDVLSDRSLTVDRGSARLAIGPPGAPAPKPPGWRRIPLQRLSVRPGRDGLVFAQIDFGDRSFPALIDLGSDATYCSWTVAEASRGLRYVRRQLYRRLRVEGAVAEFRPTLIVELAGLMMERQVWGPVEVTIMDVPSDEILGEPDVPIVIAGMNLFEEQDFVLDGAENALYLRGTGADAGPARRLGIVRFL